MFFIKQYQEQVVNAFIHKINLIYGLSMTLDTFQMKAHNINKKLKNYYNFLSATSRKKTGAVDTSSMTVATVVKRGKGEKKSLHDITGMRKFIFSFTFFFVFSFDNQFLPLFFLVLLIFILL